MGIILLQTSLEPYNLYLLRKEFPQYRALYYQFGFQEHTPLGSIDWTKVEILYGSRLTPDQLDQATQLRWIHNPTSSFSRICLDKALKRENIIVTQTNEENATAIAEFVLSGILAFAKHLFRWHDLMGSPSSIWNSKLRDSMWRLQDRIFLQIGLGAVGTEITRLAQGIGLEVWCMQERRTFHRYCHCSLSLKELSSALPKADIISICSLREDLPLELLSATELDLMKPDSILIVIGPHTVVSEHALVSIAKTGKFRGILLDAMYTPSIPSNSPLWQVPHLLITPEVSAKPRMGKEAFHVFQYNLRQYAAGNFQDMRNRL